MFLNTTFGLFVLAVYGFRPVFGSSETCDERQNTMLIQRHCKHENEAIVIAEINENHVEICRQFPLLLKCAVTAIPHCYGFVETTYSMYSHSPFSCELTETLIKELQDIQRKGTHMTKSKPERPDTTFPSNIVTQDEYFASSLAMSHRVTTAHQGNNGAHQGKNDKFESGDIFVKDVQKEKSIPNNPRDHIDTERIKRLGFCQYSCTNSTTNYIFRTSINQTVVTSLTTSRSSLPSN